MVNKKLKSEIEKAARKFEAGQEILARIYLNAQYASREAALKINRSDKIPDMFVSIVTKVGQKLFKDFRVKSFDRNGGELKVGIGVLDYSIKQILGTENEIEVELIKEDTEPMED